MFKNWRRFCKHALSENDENKIKRKRERSQKQTEFYLNVEYKFALKNNFEKNANQTI